MSDIFNIIKANIERNSRTGSEETQSNTNPNKKRKSSIDDFLIGESEKKYKEKESKKEMDLLNEEIGIEKERKDYLSSVETVNFNKLNKMRVKEQVRELTRGYIELEDLTKKMDRELLALEDDYNQKSIELHRTKKEVNRTKEFIRTLVGELPDGAKLKDRLDMTQWNINDVDQDILIKIKHIVERIKNAEVYIEKETEKVTKENRALKKKLISFEAELTKIEEKLSQGSYKNSESKEVKNERGSLEVTKGEERSKREEEKPAKEKPQIKEEQKKIEIEKEIEYELELEEEEDDGDGIVVLEVDKYIDNLSDNHKNIIKVIGEKGVSRNAELREQLEGKKEGEGFTRAGKFQYKDMSAVIKSLREGGFLEAEQVKLGSRGGYNFTVYELTDLGKAIFKSLTGKKATVSEKKKIKDQHASLEHGFLIKDVGTIFKEMDYTVYTDRKDLRFDLPNGKRKDFDIIVEKNGEKLHIEVERGTHNDEDFFDAMDKIYQITSDFYFVAPNEEKLFGKTKVQFYKWINERLGGMDKAKGKITVNFATFEKVKKKGKTIWETIKL